MNIFMSRKVKEAKMTDRCDIYRRKTIKNLDGTENVVLDKEPLYTDVHCRISFVRYKVENPAGILIDENPVELVPKIFFPVFTDIKVGDTVKLRRISTENEVLGTYEGITGLPAFYDDHTEVMLSVNTSA